MDKLLAAETDWRLANMRRNRRKPGRQFVLATYLKQPAEYLTSRHDAEPREELLGWAEWQDPGYNKAADREAGFHELGRLAVFRDTQIALRREQQQQQQKQHVLRRGSRKRTLETTSEGVASELPGDDGSVELGVCKRRP